MTLATDRDTFDYGQVISRAVDVLRRNWPLLATLTLLLYGLPKLGATLLDLGTWDLWFFDAVLSATGGVYSLVALLGYFALQATVVHVFVKDLDGETPHLGGAAHAAMTLFFPVLGVSVLFAVAVFAGLILLVIPGLMIATAWLVCMPAVVVERLSVADAFRRSAYLTRDYRWSVFGFVAGMILISIVIDNAVDEFDYDAHGFFLIETAAHAAAEVIEDILQTAAALAFALLVSSIYCELRMLKEAATPDEIAADMG